MKQEIKELIRSLFAGKLKPEEFLKRYSHDRLVNSDYLRALLKDSISAKNADLLEEAMAVIYAGQFELAHFTLEFSQLLTAAWHTRHEDIAMLLKKIADPYTVGILFDATQLNFPYLDYDDTYQFARKCIKALSDINNEEACARLKTLQGSSNSVIAGYATKELGYKGLL